jgi:trehalose 6-phosphate phosphatase
LRGELATFARRHPGLLFEDKARHSRCITGLHRGSHHTFIVLSVRASRAPRRGVSIAAWEGDGRYRTEGPHKGTAIQEYMTEPPFRGRMPVFVGDDRSDENGFAAVGSWAAGSQGRIRAHGCVVSSA